MNSKSLRRLASDHAQLAASLPPNYLFPANYACDDLSTLHVLLAGPEGTPYAAGLFQLHLTIPATYPTAPPTAVFKTRIWHPNVDESTGKICVETLKRDWDAKLTLRDVLVTIGCLLIQPNPASALNGEAGALAERDWAAFERRAGMMTAVHAPVPRDVVDAVREAKNRGEEEEKGKEGREREKERAKRKGKAPVGGVRDGGENAQADKAVRAARKSEKSAAEPLSRSMENALGIGLDVDAASTTAASAAAAASSLASSQNLALSGPASTGTPFGRKTTSASTFTADLLRSPPSSSSLSLSLSSSSSRLLPPPQSKLLASGNALPEPAYLTWYKTLRTERPAERAAREKAEKRRFKAAGWDLKMYNRGVGSGVREKRGLKRL